MSAIEQYGELADGLRLPVGDCGAEHPIARHMTCDRPAGHEGRHTTRNRSGIYGWAR